MRMLSGHASFLHVSKCEQELFLLIGWSLSDIILQRLDGSLCVYPFTRRRNWTLSIEEINFGFLPELTRHEKEH
jgi:hypothetical protein